MGTLKMPFTVRGSRLRTLRELRGKTQLEVELDANLGIGYLQRLERGKVQQPERDTLERILAALGVSFIECREIMESFEYAMPISIPNEAETRWAVTQFQAEFQQDTMPVYLLDCSHRLLAWNSLVPKLFSVISVNSTGLLMPKLVFDADKGIAASILNADAFFSAQIRIVQYEKQRCVDESWYGGFIDGMRELEIFDEYWAKQLATDHAPAPMRPRVPLRVDTGHGVALFRLISEPFVQDPRFRIIYYIPADAATLRQCLEWQS